MEYTKVAFGISKAESYQIDLLIDLLGSLGFDSFNDIEDGFEAFIQSDLFSECAMVNALEEFEEDIAYTFVVSEVPHENWNEKWEQNFSPMTVLDQCYVRATFHPAKPEFKYEVVIDPKMAFGTGHHQTTTQMMEYILQSNVRDKHVLDMGCGTGILAILAAKRGAKTVVAIDYDPLSYESTLENSELNKVSNITAICGGKEAIPNDAFDIILANINRNILLDQIPRYSEVLKSGGSIFFSGFYETPDLEIILEACKKENILYIGHKTLDNWVALECNKI